LVKEGRIGGTSGYRTQYWADIKVFDFNIPEESLYFDIEVLTSV
jgi:hypothetical protein